METIKIEKKNTLMIAHRGLSGFETENTLEAFVAAGNHSYYGIECDIHPTIDNVFVVIHDSNMKRVSGVDLIVENSDYNTIKNIDLLDLKNNINSPSLKVPTLEEYVRCCKKYQKKCVIEFKEQYTRENVIKVINIVKELEYLDDTYFISFYPDNLVFVKEYDFNIKCQLLLGEMVDIAYDFVVKYNLDIDIYYQNINKELVDFMHQHNLKVNVWTVDNKDAALTLVEMGVDYITTNILE